MRNTILCVGFLSLAFVTELFAQSYEYEEEDHEDEERGNLIRPGLPGQTLPIAPSVLPANVSFNSLSDSATDEIVEALRGSAQLCGKVVKEYMVDCMSDRLARIAAGLPTGGEYREAKQALEDTAIKLHLLAKANASLALPKIRVQANTDDQGKRPRILTPVRPETLESVKVQATAIIAEAETVLLRSAENSKKRKVHYERIARAVGSNKIILRTL